MAKRKVWIGDIGPFVYDDADTYDDGTPMRGVRVEGKIKVSEAPSDPDDVARYGDIGGVAAPEDSPYVMANNSKMTSQARILTQGNGIDIADAGPGGNIIVSAKEIEIDHDLLKNFVPNEHIDWTNANSEFKTSANVEIGATSAFYLGDKNTDGTWRIIRAGNNLEFQRREAGVWVTKQTITP